MKHGIHATRTPGRRLSRERSRMNKDTFHKLKPVQKFLNEGMESGLRAHGTATEMLDFEPATRFIETQAKKGERYTYTHLLIKAAALALREHPRLNWQMVGSKIVRPANIDIGVMVAVDRNFAPIVVIEQTDTKSLEEIARDLEDKKNLAADQLQGMLKKLSVVAALFSVPFLRRLAIKRLSRNWKLRKKLGGTFQISNPGMFGIDMMITYNIATTCIALVGKMMERPMVIDGNVVPRRCATITYSVDHRVIDAKQGIGFSNQLKYNFEHPETLDPAISSDKRS